MLITKDNLVSVKAILQLLRDFELQYGLPLSIEKTSFFSAGLSPGEIGSIKDETDLTEGTLPVRYLGVPLCTKSY